MALRFRFTDPADVAAYGDEWRTWDESDVYALRSRELIELEDQLDMPLLLAIRAFRGDAVLGRLAVMWIVLHLGGHKVSWQDFDPLALEVEWERTSTGPLDSGEDPAPGSSSSSGAAETSASPTS